MVGAGTADMTAADREAANVAALERALAIAWDTMPPEVRALLDTETQLVAIHASERRR